MNSEKDYPMPDETSPRPPEPPDDGRHRRGGGGDGSPLQARAAFFANWGWESVTDVNRRACARGGAQHGINSETGTTCAAEWNQRRPTECSLLEGYDFLRSFHRKAPFLFFNGNTFAAIGRELTLTLFSDLPPGRKKGSEFGGGSLRRGSARPRRNDLNRRRAVQGHSDHCWNTSQDNARLLARHHYPSARRWPRRGPTRWQRERTLFAAGEPSTRRLTSGQFDPLISYRLKIISALLILKVP